MKALAWAGIVLAALFAWTMPASAQTAPQIPQCQYSFGSNAYVPCTGAVAVVPPATSTPLVGTATATRFAGPFYPQLGRMTWLTVQGTWGGQVNIYATVDGICADGSLLASSGLSNGFAGFVGISNANVTSPAGIETRANAGWCLNFTITSGSVAYRLSN